MIKQEIREKVGLIRKELPDKIKKSRSIIETLTNLSEYKRAKTVMPYLSLNIEVDTKDFIKNELLKKEKTLVVPFVEGNNIQLSKLNGFDELAEGKFGILEPTKKEKYNGRVDVVLVPGVAFDKNGSRIGFGKGYYDKFLDEKDLLKIGLCFEEQMVDLIPVEKHDQQVDIVITEKRVLRCSK